MYMKKYFLIFATALVGLLVGCQREVNVEDSVPVGERLVFGDIAVNLSGESEDPDTKSVVTVNVEDFTCAYLFAFDHSTKEILAYPEEAGNLEGVKPVAVSVTDKSFNWALPVKKAMDVWVLVNPPSVLKETLNDFVQNGTDLTESDLSALNFECNNASELLNLETSGDNMPMSGMMDNITLEDFNSSLNVKVKRLFAKYDLTLDVSEWVAEGWTVNAAYIDGAKSNTEVPYFSANYKQNDSNKLKSVDFSSKEDIKQLNIRDANNKSETVSYYFLENCQNVSSSASKWDQVRNELDSEIENCSYLSINVIATKDSYEKRCFSYRIYLDSTPGSSMKSKFNVIRNTYRRITLKLGAPQDGFQWVNSSDIEAIPMMQFIVPFETSLQQTELIFEIEKDGVHSDDIEFLGSVPQDYYDYNTSNVTNFPYSGYVQLRAKTGVSGIYTLIGKDRIGDVYHSISVTIGDNVGIFSGVEWLQKAYYTCQWSVLNVHDLVQNYSSYEDVYFNLTIYNTSNNLPVSGAEYRDYISTNGSAMSFGKNTPKYKDYGCHLFYDKHSGYLYIYTGTSDKTYGKLSITVNIGDVNNDGDDDYVITNYELPVLLKPELRFRWQDIDGNHEVIPARDGWKQTVHQYTHSRVDFTVCLVDPITYQPIGSGDMSAFEWAPRFNHGHDYEDYMDLNIRDWNGLVKDSENHYITCTECSSDIHIKYGYFAAVHQFGMIECGEEEVPYVVSPNDDIAPYSIANGNDIYIYSDDNDARDYDENRFTTLGIDMFSSVEFHQKVSLSEGSKYRMNVLHAKSRNGYVGDASDMEPFDEASNNEEFYLMQGIIKSYFIRTANEVSAPTVSLSSSDLKYRLIKIKNGLYRLDLKVSSYKAATLYNLSATGYDSDNPTPFDSASGDKEVTITINGSGPGASYSHTLKCKILHQRFNVKYRMEGTTLVPKVNCPLFEVSSITANIRGTWYHHYFNNPATDPSLRYESYDKQFLYLGSDYNDYRKTCIPNFEKKFHQGKGIVVCSRKTDHTFAWNTWDEGYTDLIVAYPEDKAFVPIKLDLRIDVKLKEEGLSCSRYTQLFYDYFRYTNNTFVEEFYWPGEMEFVSQCGYTNAIGIITAIAFETWEQMEANYGPIVNYGWYVFGQPQKVHPMYYSSNIARFQPDELIPIELKSWKNEFVNPEEGSNYDGSEWH